MQRIRKIEFTTQFKRDFKRESKGKYQKAINSELPAILQALQADIPLAPHHRDHALSGNWSDHRDCHIKPDLILIYAKPDEETLRLVRLGSHAELGL